MPKGKSVTGIYPPASFYNVVDLVRQRIDNNKNVKHFRAYHQALIDLWPTLHQSDPKACVDLAFDVFVEIASSNGDVIEEDSLRLVG